MKLEYMHFCPKDISHIGSKNILNVMNYHGHFLRGIRGEMVEWFKAHAWKVCVPSQVPWVRIPLSPPYSKLNKLIMCIEKILVGLNQLFLRLKKLLFNKN